MLLLLVVIMFAIIINWPSGKQCCMINRIACLILRGAYRYVTLMAPDASSASLALLAADDVDAGGGPPTTTDASGVTLNAG